MIEGGGVQSEVRAIAEGLRGAIDNGVAPDGAGLPADVQIDNDSIEAHRIAEAADLAEVAGQVADADAEVGMIDVDAEADNNANVAAAAADNSALDADMIH